MSEITYLQSIRQYQGTRTKVEMPLGATEYKKTEPELVLSATASMLPSPFEAIALPNSEVPGSDKRVPSCTNVAWARLLARRKSPQASPFVTRRNMSLAQAKLKRGACKGRERRGGKGIG
jgi:hypothetical protein